MFGDPQSEHLSLFNSFPSRSETPVFPFLGILNNEWVDSHLAKSICQLSLVLINKGVGHRSAEVALKKGFKEVILFTPSSFMNFFFSTYIKWLSASL